MKQRQKKNRLKLTVADHMRTLPLLKRLTATQQLLVAITPTWQCWAKEQLSADSAVQAVLTHIDDGQLVITCTNASIASRIRHLQESLLTHFHNNGFNNIDRINICLEHLTGANSLHSLNSSEQHPNQQSNQSSDRERTTQQQFLQPSAKSLESIRQCQKTTDSEYLSNALQRLQKTLKNN